MGARGALRGGQPRSADHSDREQTWNLETFFAAMEDPRVERTKRHKLLDITRIAICGVICRAEGWVEIEEFGKAKEE